MRNIIFLLLLATTSLPCFANTAEGAPNSPAYALAIDWDVQMQQAILDLQKENITDKMEHHGQRVEDLHKTLNIFIAILTVLTAIIAIAAGIWMNKKTKSLRDDFSSQEKLINEKLRLLDKSIELAEGKVDLFKERIDGVIKEAKEMVHEEAESVNIRMSSQLETHLKEAKETLNDMMQSRDKAAELVKEIEDKRDSSGKLPPELEKKVSQQVAETKKKKSEEEYTADDWILKGQEARKSKHYEKAIEYYKNAIEIEPNNRAANSGLVVALILDDRYEEAIEVLEILSEISATFWGLYFYWDYILSEMKKEKSPLLEAQTKRFKEILTKNKDLKELKSDSIFQKTYNRYFPKESKK